MTENPDRFDPTLQQKTKQGKSTSKRIALLVFLVAGAVFLLVAISISTTIVAIKRMKDTKIDQLKVLDLNGPTVKKHHRGPCRCSATALRRGGDNPPVLYSVYNSPHDS